MSDEKDLDCVYFDNKKSFDSTTFDLENLDDDTILTSKDFNNTIGFARKQQDIFDRIFDNENDNEQTKLNSNLDLKQLITNKSILKDMTLIEKEEIPQKEDKDNLKLDKLNKLNKLKGLIKIKLSDKTKKAFDIGGFTISEDEKGLSLNFCKLFTFSNGEIEISKGITKLNTTSIKDKNIIAKGNNNKVYYQNEKGITFSAGVNNYTIKTECDNKSIDIKIEKGFIKSP